MKIFNSVLLVIFLILTNTSIAGGITKYAGQPCTSCHDNIGGRVQVPISNGTNPSSSTGERMSALGIKASAAGSACSASSNSMMHKAYLGYYARCPDEGGLAYWCGQLDTKSGDLSSLIAGFGTSAEYTKRFSGMTDTQLITNLYQNMFNRGADEAGLNFYINLLDQRRKEFSNSHGGNSNGATEYALSRIALDVLNGASGGDLTTLNGKVSQCSAPPEPICTPPKVLLNGVCQIFDRCEKGTTYCIALYAPVICADGKTYGNQCEANAACAPMPCRSVGFGPTDPLF